MTMRVHLILGTAIDARVVPVGLSGVGHPSGPIEIVDGGSGTGRLTDSIGRSRAILDGVTHGRRGGGEATAGATTTIRSVASRRSGRSATHRAVVHLRHRGRTRVAVLAVARGKLDADDAQTCAFAVDAPGVTSGLPPNLGLDPSEGTLGPFMVAFEAAGKSGVFGVHLGVVDPMTSTPAAVMTSRTDVTIDKVDVGFDGIVVTDANGGRRSPGTASVYRSC